MDKSRLKQNAPRRRPAPAAHHPVFQTDRLDVFKIVIVRNPKLGSPRTVYQGWHRKEDVPRPIVTLTLSPGTTIGDYVEWIETTDQYQEEGFASELWEGVESHLKTQLVGEGVTVKGEKFFKSIERDRAERTSSNGSRA